MNRPNLTVYTQAQVSKLNIDKNSKRVDSVEVQIGSAKFDTLFAEQQIILSAGAYNSPQILQLSGIGPKKVIEDVGISCIHELPGVGENLQDHFDFFVNGIDPAFPSRVHPVPQNIKYQYNEIMKYKNGDHTGMATYNFAQ